MCFFFSFFNMTNQHVQSVTLYWQWSIILLDCSNFETPGCPAEILHCFFSERHFWKCRQSIYHWFYQRRSFLANVNSSSGSLYVVVRPSVVCLSSVVCDVRAPYSGDWNFRQFFTPFGTLAIRDLCVKILRRSSQGNPSSGGLNRRGVAKYSDFGPFQGYISETMQDRR